ncbi:MAG: prepilin-type N-terminal cleavage/methylation domain-containing protein [Phycisphaeraceae bacterium]|nr:prepilin-type N-terminal cleavage/methylation domain-containing protein [Phycisphaeraceae bacterium]
MKHFTRSNRAFSLIEMLIALTITSTLMVATMTALHASFRAYKFTTDAASTHVVSRIVMHRLLTMVRTGDQFGPYPADVLARSQNPVESTYLEFVSYYDANTMEKKIVRVERRDPKAGEQGPYTLYMVQKTYSNDTLTDTQDQPLLQGVTDVKFTLEYDIGPRLRRATLDLTVQPADTKDTSLHTELSAPTIRLVSSVMPRRLEIVE